MAGTILNRYNSDDSFFRAVIVGLLNLMNNKLSIWNRLDEDHLEEVNVPFFYSMAGDERFMQDLFLQDTMNDCIDYKVTEGNINKIPSGVIRVSTISLDTARMTNRFVRGEYTKTVNGELITYNSFHNLVPVNITTEVEIKTDSQLDMFKMVESLIKTFYKTFIYSVLFNGYVIRCQVGFPEEFTSEKPYEFSFGEDSQPKITFNIETETYYPIIDPTQEFKKSQMITSFQTNFAEAIFSDTSGKAINDTFAQQGADIADDTKIPTSSKNFLNI